MKGSVAVLLMLYAVAARGQTFAGGERENYLRYLQTVRLAPLYPWGVRAFGASEIDGLTGGRADGRLNTLEWLPVSGSLRYNTTFPYGYNDGPIWAGKGATLALEGGFVVRRGVLSLTIAPLAFVAENARFPLMGGTFADGSMGANLDRPQRFGNDTYTRLDPGQSTLRLDWHALAAGVSTANEYWGPATEFPLILGNNAAGFAHAFVGTAHPLSLGPLALHGRVLWGRLGQSAFSAESVATRRFAAGIVLDLTSRYVPGLELGATRFAHQPWRSGGPTLRDALAPFQGTEKSLRTSNELASVFFRWVLPHSGFEIYGEYGRDDYAANLRDFVLEPDRTGGYMLGFRKVLMNKRERFVALRAEVQNTQLSNVAQGNAWSPFYTHILLRQGHTQLGQVLGSEAGPGGQGAVLAVESYSPSGRWTWSWTRLLRQQRGDPSGTIPDPKGLDVQHGLAVERLQRHGRYEWLARVTAVAELNRNYTYDALDVNLIVGVRFLNSRNKP